MSSQLSCKQIFYDMFKFPFVLGIHGLTVVMIHLYLVTHFLVIIHEFNKNFQQVYVYKCGRVLLLEIRQIKTDVPLLYPGCWCTCKSEALNSDTQLSNGDENKSMVTVKLDIVWPSDGFNGNWKKLRRFCRAVV